MRTRLCLSFALLLVLGANAPAQSTPAQPAIAPAAQQQPASPVSPEETAIRSALDLQVAAWNRGDIPAFMAGYDDSPLTTFIGTKGVEHGFQPILQRYLRGYANKDQMGTLTFSELDVRLLPSSTGQVEYAVVTGRFHLARTAYGAAKQDDGIFSLLWHKSPSGWKILLDHTA